MEDIAIRRETSEFAEIAATPARGPLRIEYRWLNRELSDSPVLVFLHEGLGSIRMWKGWPQALCDMLGMRGLVYSRPGYGASTPRPPQVKLSVDFMHQQAHDILPAFLDAIRLSQNDRARMWLIGHSDGGSITLLYASKFPSALAGAVVIAPHVVVEQLTVDSIRKAKIAYQETTLREKLARYHDDVDSAFFGWNDVWLAPEFLNWNITDNLTEIYRPLLVVQGYDDEYGTMKQLEIVKHHVPHAQLTKLHACGHSPHRDAPAALNSAIASFVLPQCNAEPSTNAELTHRPRSTASAENK